MQQSRLKGEYLRILNDKEACWIVPEHRALEQCRSIGLAEEKRLKRYQKGSMNNGALKNAISN